MSFSDNSQSVNVLIVRIILNTNTLCGRSAVGTGLVMLNKSWYLKSLKSPDDTHKHSGATMVLQAHTCVPAPPSTVNVMSCNCSFTTAKKRNIRPADRDTAIVTVGVATLCV